MFIDQTLSSSCWYSFCFSSSQRALSASEMADPAVETVLAGRWWTLELGVAAASAVISFAVILSSSGTASPAM